MARLRILKSLLRFVELIEEHIAVMTPLVNGLEATAQRLDSYIVEWPRLSPEQQNRRLILALAERLKK